MWCVSLSYLLTIIHNECPVLETGDWVVGCVVVVVFCYKLTLFSHHHRLTPFIHFHSVSRVCVSVVVSRAMMSLLALIRG